MARTLTAANSILLLSIEGLYGAPQQIQGFSADDVTDIGNVSSAETMMGVDGHLSGGFTPVPFVQSIVLQADSLSNDIFDRWFGAQMTTRETYVASGTIILPGTQRKYSCVRGFLTGYKPIPGVKKILQPRSYEITWESVRSSPQLPNLSSLI